MKRRMIEIAVLFALACQPILAQTLLPATSEDINDFDRRVSDQIAGDSGAKHGKSSSGFGTSVSDEAKKLKDANSDSRRAFGKWVSGQRKKADAGRPSSAGAVGTSRGSSTGSSASDSHGPPSERGKKK